MPCAEVGCVETSNIDIRAASPTVTTATQTRIRPTCIVRPLQSVELEKTQPVISPRQNSNTNQPIRKAEIPQRVRNRLAKVTWYLGSKSANEVRLLLDNQPEGTFLVRDSESANHMFSISSRTPRGTTSVRVKYDLKQDTFQLDVGAGFESKFASQSPRFSCITDVVSFLMKTSFGDEGHQCLCIESNGRGDTPFLLKHPYRQTHD